MRTLIVPCAGARKIDELPLFLNTYPDGELLAIKTIRGVYPERYDKIIFAILKEIDEKYNAREIILKANNNRYVIDFVFLNEETSGPAETIYRTLLNGNVEGEFAVRDSHAYLEIKKDYNGNFVAGLDLTKYERPIADLRRKSFISINEQGQILDVVEKHFCSDVISAGFYGFKSSLDYIKAYEHLNDENYEIEKLYISHVISYLIGYSQRVFHWARVVEFEDWSSDISWNNVQKRNSLCFIDLDNILFDDNTRYKLMKLSHEGMKFVGYSHNSSENLNINTQDINIVAIIGDCPITNSKELISKDADIDKLILEV